MAPTEERGRLSRLWSHSTVNEQATSTVKPSRESHLWNDLRILWHMVVTRGQGRTHEERLENFYKGQAAGYDAFRKRLLHGREELFARLPAVEGGIWVDLGAGTGENAEHWGPRLTAFAKVYLVDLSTSLLKIAEERVRTRGWTNVTTVHHDATTFVPPEGAVDLVTCSYSLTMIPDWFVAIDQAERLLKPGGMIGVVDFFVARKFPSSGLVQHGWATRTFWPAWFATDNVFLSPDHLPYLQHKFETLELQQSRGKVPYLPWVRAPYYLFIGRKRSLAVPAV